jgi:hypothetical protein
MESCLSCRQIAAAVDGTPETRDLISIAAFRVNDDGVLEDGSLDVQVTDGSMLWHVQGLERDGGVDGSEPSDAIKLRGDWRSWLAGLQPVEQQYTYKLRTKVTGMVRQGRAAGCSLFLPAARRASRPRAWPPPVQELSVAFKQSAASFTRFIHVPLQPAAHPAQAIVSAAACLMSSLRQARAAADALRRHRDALRQVADTAQALVQEHLDLAAEVDTAMYGRVAALLNEKKAELRAAAGAAAGGQAASDAETEETEEEGEGGGEGQGGASPAGTEATASAVTESAASEEEYATDRDDEGGGDFSGGGSDMEQS